MLLLEYKGFYLQICLFWLDVLVFICLKEFRWKKLVFLTNQSI